MNAVTRAHLLRNFARIGTVARIRPSRWNRFSLDIERVGRLERYVIEADDDVDVAVVDVQPRDRHLLLMIKNPNEPNLPNSKYLCGHDERHYFVAIIPEVAGATTVETAKQALKPREILRLEARVGIKSRNIHSRRRRLGNGMKIYRQGEFMFVPAPDFVPAQPLGIQHDEMMTRTSIINRLFRGRNPHIAKELYREEGEMVYVNRLYPAGLTEQERQRLFAEDDKAQHWGWRAQTRNPIVHVRGTVRHAEHATIHLGRTWHRVYLNTENLATRMGHLAFVD
ncbi:hypothetical protein GC170_13440 [bacterium]|nr:hypothetical protein [bacterium]